MGLELLGAPVGRAVSQGGRSVSPGIGAGMNDPQVCVLPFPAFRQQSWYGGPGGVGLKRAQPSCCVASPCPVFPSHHILCMDSQIFPSDPSCHLALYQLHFNGDQSFRLLDTSRWSRALEITPHWLFLFPSTMAPTGLPPPFPPAVISCLP